MEIVVGDRLRWTSTDKSKNQINGQTFTVTAIEGTTLSAIDKKGNILDTSLMQPLAIDYEGVSTSYRAQGKTAKRVIVSATNDPTSSREPFYVKISRQTKELSIYTQELKQLRKWVEFSNAQSNPLELIEENYAQRNSSNSFTFGYSGATQPHGTANQLNGQQVQPNPIDYPRSIERLCNQVNRTTIDRTIGGLREVVDGIYRGDQQLHREFASGTNLTGEISGLDEQLGGADRGSDRAKEEQLIAIIQQRQIFESIKQPLLKLRNALNEASSIQPIETKPLAELVETLQQSVNQAKERTNQAIQDEKLNILARAITQWKADSATTKALQLQKIAESVQQIRAEDYIYIALHDFNQALNKGIKSFGTNTQQLDALLDELRSQLINLKTAERVRDDCPLHIDSKHWREWVEDSCIHPTIAEARLQTIYGNQVYERLLSEKLATMASGQYVTQPMARLMKTYQQLAEHGGWWVDSGVDPRSFPMLEPGQKPQMSLYGTFKPNNPRIDTDGDVRKYENPLGLKQRLFERDLNFSAVPDEIAEQIYRKYNVVPTAAEKASGFWYVVYKHPEIPIYRTEGNKKDAAITSLGCVVISGQGVNAGYKAKDQLGNRLPQRVLHPQLDVFAQPGREIRFAFDQDSKLSTILNVRQDLVREAELLKERGCNIYCLKWDGSRGKGIDDLIKNHGSSAFAQADRQAVPIEKVIKQHYRTKYNATAKQVQNELGNISQARVDLEVYVRTIQKGHIEDGVRFIAESDTSRYIRTHSPEAAQQYIKAISSMVGTYKRLANRDVEDLDIWVEKAVQQQIVALGLQDEPTVIKSVQTRKPQL